ncbi:MAG: hypothetical protein HeimC2_33850 [Candidatus Heimdallarchaeota archaeon LC_2]|nr:MAG: hypothetical protein HeimC2_33850 [Candidatus Heimdallarchaeota archaeon LC_2]
MRSRIFIMIIFVILLPSLNYQNQVSAQIEIPDAFIYLSDFSEIEVDGVISENEYPQSITINSINGEFVNYLSWVHNTTHLAIGLTFNSTGWIGIGLGEVGSGMASADIIVASIVNDQVTIYDMYATGRNVTIEDIDSYIDLNYVAGSETADQTILEMIIPLQSGDTDGNDHNWQVNNTYGFFTAYHQDLDDITVIHTSHSPILSTKLLHSSANVKEIQIEFEIVELNNGTTLILSANVIDVIVNNAVPDLKIEFYRKTEFGRLLLGSDSTDASGNANITIDIHFSGNVSLFAYYAGSEFIERNEVAQYWLSPIPYQSDDEKFGDLRDTFNDEFLIRHFLTGLLVIILLILTIAYLTVFRDLIKLFNLRNDERGTEEEIE